MRHCEQICVNPENLSTATTFFFTTAAINMVAKTQEPFFQGSTGKNSRGVLRIVILCLIAGAAIASRLFSVIRKYLKLHIINWISCTLHSIEPHNAPVILSANVLIVKQKLILLCIGFESIIHECQY